MGTRGVYHAIEVKEPLISTESKPQAKRTEPHEPLDKDVNDHGILQGSKANSGGVCTSHLYAADSELCEGSAHLGGSCGVVLAVGNDFDQEGVIVG